MNIIIIKKRILIILFFVFFSQNLMAEVGLKKLDTKEKFPNIFILDNKGKSYLLKFSDISYQNGYVINFWATWCLPCKKELPDLSLLKLKLYKHKIDVITISIDKKNIKEQLTFLSKNNGSNLTSFFDKKKKLYKALNLRGIPTTILIDKNGFIISKHEGILKWGEDKVVKKIINLID
jgi:thiol-disulfide isomerase/thioredoxin